MQSISAKQGQTLLDIALEQAGSIVPVFRNAIANGLSVTDTLLTGEVLVVETEGDEVVKKIFLVNDIQPASAD